MHIFKQHGPVELVRVFEGEITAVCRRPAVGRTLQKCFEEISSALTLVRILTSPKSPKVYMIDLMRG